MSSPSPIPGLHPAEPTPSGASSANLTRPILSRPGAGIAPIKPEYIISLTPLETPDDDAAESSTAHTGDARDRPTDSRDLPHNKRQRTTEGGEYQKMTKAEKKARQGQNKGRVFKPVHDEVNICWAYMKGECWRGDKCKMSHNIPAYLSSKTPDIHLPSRLHSTLSSSSPYILPTSSTSTPTDPDPLAASFNLTTTCPVYEALGYCTAGWKCRFLGGHVERVPAAVVAPEGEEMVGENVEKQAEKQDGKEKGSRGEDVSVQGGWRLKVDEAKKRSVQESGEQKEFNGVLIDDMRDLTRKRFPFPASIAYCAAIDPTILIPQNAPRSPPLLPKILKPSGSAEMDEEEMMAAMEAEEQETLLLSAGKEKVQEEAGMTGREADGDDTPLRGVEKRRLDWRGKRYLAPLTTVGNLPFRRVCVDYGADITCGEMALGHELINGKADEWALARRHASEKMFGVQVCGGKPGVMVPTAEAIRKLLGDRDGNGVDFVDLNIGCPIDLVFQRGGGSALLEHGGKLGKIIVGMNKVLGDIPITVKFRTGVTKSKNIAHNLVPRFAGEWGVSAMTLHGRSRQQRYAKNADWAYIKHCATVLRESCSDAGLPAPPIFGNGDCYSAQSYYEEMEESGVDGVMVARGALIKPWIFEEIKEKREWDISAVERLEGYRKFAEYGLNHWGSDTKGVNTTRRFLCEAMSFQHRYIPIGLLERMPPQINERPPAYVGRSELETLLASPDSRDWVTISEMFLGPTPDDFKFAPKHKSNAYGDAAGEAQG